VKLDLLNVVFNEILMYFFFTKPPKKSTTKAQKFEKADWKEGFKKKQVGVADMTMLSKVNNEAINENLKKRFENAEIYVCN
jgi:myosin I